MVNRGMSLWSSQSLIINKNGLYYAKFTVNLYILIKITTLLNVLIAIDYLLMTVRGPNSVHMYKSTLHFEHFIEIFKAASAK